MFVVHFSVVIVAEDLVGLRDGFEFDVGFFSLVVGYFVGVGGEGCLGYMLELYRVHVVKESIPYLVICLLDFGFGSSFRYA